MLKVQNFFCFVVVLLLSISCVVECSSHSEAPGTAKAPQTDITDLYMFRCYEPGREDFTCFVINAQPLQKPYAGPNYFALSDDHFYELYIDNNGDGEEDLTFQYFLGNRLGGELEDVLLQADEDDCVLNLNTRSVAPEPVYARRHGGIAVNVDGRSVPIALKTAGPITAGNNGALNWIEWYRINLVVGDRTFGSRSAITNSANGNDTFTKPFDNAGTKTFPDYESYANQYIYSIRIPGCNTNGRVFVGQRAESFAISLGEVFDLINFIPIPGFPGAVDENAQQNDLKDVNIDSFVLEVPTSCLVVSGQGGVIGAWAGVRSLHHSYDEHVPGKQLNRLGNPLVNELLVGLKDKGEYNSRKPVNDIGFLDLYINYPSFPEIINILFLDAVNDVLNANLPTIAPTNFPREDLFAIFFTGIPSINQPPNVVPAEMMRLNTSTPVTPRNSQSPFGVIGGDAAGYPNGRRPGDDSVDITLRAAMGRLCNPLELFCSIEDAVVGNVDLTDGVPTSALDFDNAFPYLRTPYPGSTGI